ncbi:MAG: IS1595 family transposase [Gammaproteobacteria bacterium]
MAKLLTVQEFFQLFPDDDTCLDHVMAMRYGNPLVCPKCGKHGKFHRLRKEPAYCCQWCGHRIYPMVDTPFERTRTPLQKWFYAMYLFTTSGHGVPAKELQRQLGVTYKTAWRIGHELRKYMAVIDGDPPLSGHVEADGIYVGGRRKGGKRGRGAPGKTVVFGMLEREGDVMTRVVPNVKRKTLEPHIIKNIQRGSVVSTDELKSYGKLARHGYKHGSVNHSADEWANGTHHVNSLEGFWSRLKNSIRGTHIHVSGKHLPKYLGAFEFRYNLRHEPETMFWRLLLSL